ncbi:protein of unknown function [Xenorhabdus doucetiae]|uniref:Uncharacterized protein n=1 Tax=Xenorhabdus doucetiae TaxID=351671 RepID=A0A068QTE3_9GAMM|nr:protein of unknown function [Xenorhabdus doucetiae]
MRGRFCQIHKVKTRYLTEWLREITGSYMVPATGVELVTY